MILYPHQKEALNKIKNGCILCGSVGSGKSKTSLAYYYIKVCQGSLDIDSKKSNFKPFKEPKDLYIITTAKKRDSLEWDSECTDFRLYRDNPDCSISNVKVTIDSWNNIKKYETISNAFFIFDEQRVVGSGTWVKTFYKITAKNQWILLTATPGDVWTDYIPVFVANGFYRNKTDFNAQHVIYKPFTKYHQIDRYVNIKKLKKCQSDILVDMDFDRHTVRHHIQCVCLYDHELYKKVFKDRWNVYKNEPIQEPSSLMYTLRRVVNSDIERQTELVKILEKTPKCIIYYSFDYELEIIRDILDRMVIPYTEWNGHKHESILEGDNWAYIVQYTAGAEGWNCITTDTIIFYSQTYSYKTLEQCRGRIDRMNTPYKDLYYYYIRTNSSIDNAIRRALINKSKFNERAFLAQK